MTTISVKYPIIGAKVVRGKDWGYGNQDGGEGNIGTIVEKSGRNGWVEVKWKECNTNLYRIGCDGMYDLYFATEKDALLQEAMERFPVGTSFHPAHAYREGEYCTITKDSVFIINSDEIIASVNGENWIDPNSENQIYGNTNYNRFVYYQGKWAIKANIPPKTEKEEEIIEQKVEVFPGIYVGDIVVSLRDSGDTRKIGDIFKVLPDSKKYTLFYRKTFTITKKSCDETSWRLATPEEINAYYVLGIRNIDEIAYPIRKSAFYCETPDSSPINHCAEIELPNKKHQEIDVLSVFSPKKQQGMNMDVFTQQTPAILNKPKPQLITI